MLNVGKLTAERLVPFVGWARTSRIVRKMCLDASEKPKALLESSNASTS